MIPLLEMMRYLVDLRSQCCYASVLTNTTLNTNAIPNGEPAGDLYTPLLQAHKESKAADWELAIQEAREDVVGESTDGSMDEVEIRPSVHLLSCANSEDRKYR